MTASLVRDPVYLQLNKALRDLIRSGQVPLGDRFWTEREIGSRFGVSRATANKALSNLVAEGVLEFRKGLGTFVRSRPLDYDLQSLVSFTDKARAAGVAPTTQLLRFETLPARSLDPALVEQLKAGSEANIYYMERLRLADNLPVIFEQRHVLAEFCPELGASELLASLYDTWIRKYGLEIAGAEQTIRAINLRGREAKLLRVAGRAAGFMVVSTGYLYPRRPLWCERTFYRGDAYEFQNFLGPVQTAGPASGVLRSVADDCDRP